MCAFILSYNGLHFISKERIRLSEYKHNLMLIYSKYSGMLIVLKNSASVNTMVKKNFFLIFGRIVANYYLRKNKLHVCFKVVFLNSSFCVFRRMSAGFLVVLMGKGHLGVIVEVDEATLILSRP